MRKIPKLRFKEFNDEWEKLNAEEIFENISNKKHNGDLPILAVTQDKGVVYRDSLELKINSSEEGIKNYKIIEPGNFIISLRSFQGGIEYSDILGIGSPAYTILKSKKNIKDIFYKFYLKKTSFISELNKTIEGIRDGKQISYSMFSKLKLSYPSLQEQQKIADFLSSVDKKISLTEERLELFKEYKKGVMQKIFSQELRFKDSEGNDYPQWEEKRLGEIVVSKSSTISQSTLENNDGIYSIYGATGKIKNINFYDNENDYIGIVKDGAGVGRTFLCEGKSSVLSTLNYLEVKQNSIYLKFVYYSLNQIDFSKYIVGSSIPHIYYKDYKKEKINLPTLEEQQKIADFLSSIDNKLECMERELEGLKEFKKGLLQQMFV